MPQLPSPGNSTEPNLTSHATPLAAYSRTLSRRDALYRGVTACALASTGLSEICTATTSDDPYQPFQMGIQSYSLRGYGLDDALKHTRALGLRFWESYRGHFAVTTVPKDWKQYQETLKRAGVRMVAFGVEPFTENKDENRRRFEFAKAMGIETLSADPTPESLDHLDRLVEEYDVSIAIHNHGPGARYDSIEDTSRVLANHHEKIGACVDTGHYLRSREDPLKALHTFGKRVYGVHLKDVKQLKGKESQFTILGEGDLDVDGCLRYLYDVKYAYCMALEYEENEENPIADLQQSLAVVRKSLQKIRTT